MTKEEAIKAIGEYLATADEAGHIFQIGRASCRERVYLLV